MRAGDLFKSATQGLLRFDRWDSYQGETTAEFTLLDHNDRKDWLLPSRLGELVPFVPGRNAGAIELTHTCSKCGSAEKFTIDGNAIVQAVVEHLPSALRRERVPL